MQVLREKNYRRHQHEEQPLPMEGEPRWDEDVLDGLVPHLEGLVHPGIVRQQSTFDPQLVVRSDCNGVG